MNFLAVIERSSYDMAVTRLQASYIAKTRRQVVLATGLHSQKYFCGAITRTGVRNRAGAPSLRQRGEESFR